MLATPGRRPEIQIGGARIDPDVCIFVSRKVKGITLVKNQARTWWFLIGCLFEEPFEKVRVAVPSFCFSCVHGGRGEHFGDMF